MKPTRLRLLHVVRNLNDGGMEHVVADLARTADPTGFDVHVMTLGGFGRFAGDAGDHTTLHRAPRMSRFSMLRPAALAREIRSVAPDVVHTHSGTWYKVARAARLAGVPLVYTEHGRHHPDPWINRRLDRSAARLTARVVAVSQALGGYLTARLGVRPERLAVIKNGVDLGRLDAAGAPRAGNGGAVVFGTLGRLEPVKGYDVLLAALARWPADAPPVTLLIAGDGSERPRLEALAREWRLGDRVRFPGWVERPEQRFYASLDGFVLSSHSEGTSISLLEAMASRCAPVVTDVGGNREVLGAELAEWVVPPGDPAALAQAMAAQARSCALRERLGHLARARIEQEYSLTVTASRYAHLYRALGAAPVSDVAQSPSFQPASR